jgi:Flp pilus assembly protein TadB
LISSLCTVFDFFSVLFLISSLYWSKTVQRRNQKQYREEIKNSTERRNQKQYREKKSKTVQRRNKKQYREEIKNSTDFFSVLFLISSLCTVFDFFSLYCFWFLLCTVFDFFSVLFLISSLYCFLFLLYTVFDFFSMYCFNQKQYREEIKNSTEKKSKTV